jgi:hypothetical protein
LVWKGVNEGRFEGLEGRRDSREGEEKPIKITTGDSIWR